MATQFAIDCALMAGAAYRSTRSENNRIPSPTGNGWEELPSSYRNIESSGFEAVSFQRDDEIVISFAGTYGNEDILADILLGTGGFSQQLQDAAEYYLEIKVSNPDAKITLTGHSLGGGLASLIAVFFNENAVTFDQAPFRAVASVHTPESPDLDPYRFLLFALQDNEGIDQSLLQPLEEYVAEVDLGNIANVLQEREENVINTRVDGEFLTADLPFSILDGIGSTPAENILTHGGTDIPSGDLHSMALLTVFLQCPAFREVTNQLVTFKSCGTARKRSCFHDCKGSALSWLKHEQEGVMCENGPSTARRSTWGPPAAVEKTLPRSAFGA